MNILTDNKVDGAIKETPMQIFGSYVYSPWQILEWTQDKLKKRFAQLLSLSKLTWLNGLFF